MADSTPVRRNSWNLRKLWELRRKTSQSKMAALKLFIRRNCVSCRIVWLYLIQNKLPFSIIDIDESGAAGICGLSPLGTVPLLQDGSVTLYGSQSIVYYVAEKYTDFAGLGKTPEERAQVESVIFWASTSLLRDVGHNYVYPSLQREGISLSGTANVSLTSFGKSEVLFHLDTLEKHYLAKKKFLCGSSVCFADNWVAITLSLLELVNLNLETWPKLQQWMNVMKSNVDYVDVSHAHEENVRTCCYSTGSTQNLKS